VLIARAALKARSEGSQGQVRSQAEHAAPGNREFMRRPERAAEHDGRVRFFLLPRWGATRLSVDPGAARFAYSLLATFAAHLRRAKRFVVLCKQFHFSLQDQLVSSRN